MKFNDPKLKNEIILRIHNYIDRGDKIWGFSFAHCGEVYNTLSLYRRVLFERFHCILMYNIYLHTIYLCISKNYTCSLFSI